MRDLKQAIEEGKVDPEVLPVLELINERKDSFTTSSCAGRIGLLEIPEIGDKQGARFIGKWHRVVSREEVRKALESYEKDYLYLMVQSPIFHIYCRTENEAKQLFRIGKEAGFKDTSYRTLSTPYLVELMSTEQLSIPLAMDGEIFPNHQYLDFMVERANTAYGRASIKLRRLEELLKDLTSPK